MKKLVLPLILLIAYLASGCTNNDELYTIPQFPGIEIPENEFQMVFCPTEENHEITFKLESKGSKILINWGDDTKLHAYDPSGEISHIYPPEEDKFIITVKAERLTAVDFTHENSLNISALYFGECPELKDFSFNKVNKLYAMDLRKCPQFRNIEMRVYTPNYDWSGFTNAESFILELCHTTDIDLTGYTNLTDCHMFLDPYKANMINILRLSNVPRLKTLTINSSNDVGLDSQQFHINSLDFDAPALERLELFNIHTNNNTDFSKLIGLDVLCLYGFSSNGDLKFPHNLLGLKITNQFNRNVNWHLKTLDISNVTNLESLEVEIQPSLTHINLGKAELLKSFWLQMCDGLTRLNLDNYPSLKDISCFGNKNLSEVSMVNLPELTRISFSNNPNISHLSLNNSPKIWDVNIPNNNLSSEAIKSLFTSLPKEYSGEGIRRYNINGNPGDTPETHNFISIIGQWIEFSTIYPNKFSGQSRARTINSDKGVIRLKGY